MNANQYRAAIKRLGFAQSGVANDTGQSAAARFFGRDERTGRLWAEKGPPAPVAVCLNLMLALKITADKARKLLEERNG